MASFRSFLIIDNDPRSCLLVSTTLSRHYPNAVIQSCHEESAAIRLVHDLPATEQQTVVVVHQTLDQGGRELVTAVRAANSSVPIVWMGHLQDALQAAAAGATRFLDQEAWLSIGKTVKGLA